MQNAPAQPPFFSVQCFSRQMGTLSPGHTIQRWLNYVKFPQRKGQDQLNTSETECLTETSISPICPWNAHGSWLWVTNINMPNLPVVRRMNLDRPLKIPKNHWVDFKESLTERLRKHTETMFYLGKKMFFPSNWSNCLNLEISWGCKWATRHPPGLLSHEARTCTTQATSHVKKILQTGNGKRQNWLKGGKHTL